jgi:hypothetical protein
MATVVTRSALLPVILGALLLSPVAVGAFEVLPYALIALVPLIFAVYAFGPGRSRSVRQVAVVLVAVCVAVTLGELLARPILAYAFDFRPADRFIYQWPPLPRLQRYVANVDFEGPTYGDLAAASGRREWREERRIKFVTDAYGFRNDPSSAGNGAGPLDLIVLGDSFGVAASTSQEHTLSSVLIKDYRLSVYNLSISRQNLLQEYANLVLEGDRLQTREGTSVLWLVFPGNDLDEPYYPELETPQPRWPGLPARFMDGITGFRARSALRRLTARSEPLPIIERQFIDGRRILFHPTYAARRSRAADEIRRHPNFESLKATLGAMARLAATRRLSVTVAIVPTKEEVYSWVLDGTRPWSADAGTSDFSLVLRGLSEERGFRFLDLKPPLTAASVQAYEKRGELLWWSDDSHWNDAGQRVAAAAVYEALFTKQIAYAPMPARIQ